MHDVWLITLILSFRRLILWQNSKENKEDTAFPFSYLAQNGAPGTSIIIIIIIYEWNNASLVCKLMKPFP